MNDDFTLVMISDSLEYNSNALPATDASRPNVNVPTRPLKLIRKVRSDSAPRCAKGVSKGNRSAVQIRFRHVQFQLLRACQELGREGLVDFKPIDIGQCHPSGGERAFDRGHWSDAHDRGFASRNMV